MIVPLTGVLTAVVEVLILHWGLMWADVGTYDEDDGDEPQTDDEVEEVDAE